MVSISHEEVCISFLVTTAHKKSWRSKPTTSSRESKAPKKSWRSKPTISSRESKAYISCIKKTKDISTFAIRSADALAICNYRQQRAGRRVGTGASMWEIRRVDDLARQARSDYLPTTSWIGVCQRNWSAVTCRANNANRLFRGDIRCWSYVDERVFRILFRVVHTRRPGRCTDWTRPFGSGRRYDHVVRGHHVRYKGCHVRICGTGCAPDIWHKKFG